MQKTKPNNHKKHLSGVFSSLCLLISLPFLDAYLSCDLGSALVTLHTPCHGLPLVPVHRIVIRKDFRDPLETKHRSLEILQ